MTHTKIEYFCISEKIWLNKKKAVSLHSISALKGRFFSRMTQQVNILWNQCRDILADNMSNSAFQTWFAPIVPLSFHDNVLVLQVKSQFIAEYIEENYIDLLSKVLFRVFGPETRLQYRVLIDADSGAGSTIPSDGAQTRMHEPITNAVQHAAMPASTLDSQLNENYTFATFIAGEPNKLARSAGLTIAKKPGYNTFNPFFLYGGSGVGKTHLANAIGNQVKISDPSKRVLYVAANTFKLQYQDAATNNRIPDFLNFYQQIDVLIVDDVQYFSGLKGTQDTFFHIFNYLQQSHKQLILTSDRSPLELKDIEDRLLTRFKWGLCAEITRPDFALRKAILLSKMQHEGVSLSDEVVDFIATNVTSSIRDLEGVLASLLAYSTLEDKDIDLALTEQVVGRLVDIRPRQVELSEILQAVSEHYNVSVKAITSIVRSKEIMAARHVAIYLSHTLTDNSLSEIGMYMGNRSHATVLHSCSVIENQLKNDPVLRHQVNQIQSVLTR